MRKQETLGRLKKDIEESKGKKVVLSSTKGKELMEEDEDDYEEEGMEDGDSEDNEDEEDSDD